MIDAIEINIKNGIFSQINALIYYPKKVCYLNNKKYNVDDKFLDEIVNTILYWDNEYGIGKGIDMEEFTIIVYSNKKKTKYHGKGKYPDNYSRIKELLGELNDR